MVTQALGFKTPFFGARPLSNASPTVQQPLLFGQSGADSVHFGLKTSSNLPVDPPLNLHTKEKPFDATVVSVETLKPEGGKTPPSKADVVKLVLDITGSNFVAEDGTRRISPGHSLLVLPNIPKELNYLKAYRKIPYHDTAKLELKDDAHRSYLLEHRYSVADIHEGPKGVTLTMFIKRVEYEQDGQKKQGFLSNQLANLKPGEKITMFGPNTNRFLMPPTRDANMLIFCTGLAAMSPVQDFLHTRFEEQTGEIGETYLYSGYRHHDDEMNEKKYKEYEKDQDNRFTYQTAFSQDPKNPQRVEDLIRKDGDKILELLKKDNTYVYICGVYGTEVSVISALLNHVVKQESPPISDVLDLIQEMRKSGRWREEGSRQRYRYN